MTILSGVKIICGACRVRGDVHRIDGVNFDPPGWTKKGSDTLCAACTKKAEGALLELHPEVLAAAERVVHKIQSLMASELCAQPPPGAALTFGSNGMARRMKRCELLSRYADVIMTIYGNTVAFRLAAAGAFAQTTLGEVATACEELMKAEVAFSEARATSRRPFKPTSSLRQYGIDYETEDYGAVGPRISGPLYRLQEVSKVAQKLAQLAATRAGEVVGNQEDAFLDRAVDDVEAFQEGGLFTGRPLRAGGAMNEAVTMQRQLMMMVQGFLTKEEERKERVEASLKPSANLADLSGFNDPLYELERLIETRKKLVEAGRTGALEAVDAKILLAEARLRVSVEHTTVDVALAAEAGAKTVGSVPKAFDGTLDAPPDAEELAKLRRDLGDDAVKAAFPEAYVDPTEIHPSDYLNDA